MVMDLPRAGAPPFVGVPPDLSRSKSRKKRKDPNAPKRATNAYMVFCRERRASLKEERPDLQFGKLGAKLGEMWRTMSAEEKRPYESRASGDRDRYKAEMGSYQSANMLKGNAMNQLATLQQIGGGTGGVDEYAHLAKRPKIEGADGNGGGADYASQMSQAQMELMQRSFIEMQQQQAQQQLAAAAGMGLTPEQIALMQQQIQQQQMAGASAAGAAAGRCRGCP